MKRIFIFLAVSALFAFNAMAQETPTLCPVPELGEVQTDALGYWLPRLGWSSVPADFPVVIDEDFQSWEQNHDKENSTWDNQGRAANDKPTDWRQPVTVKGGDSEGQTAYIDLIKCTVAPKGYAQNFLEFGRPLNDPQFKPNGYMNYGASGQIPYPQDAMGDADPLSPGFLEISRCNNNGTGTDLRYEGAYHGSVTLPAIKGALLVQYVYSSIGGNKRALKVERSIDGGATWEIIRNPMYVTSQFADTDPDVTVTYPSGADDTPTDYPKKLGGYFVSGAGVYLEDYIGDGEETVSVRFTICDAWRTDDARDANDHGTLPDEELGIPNVHNHAEMQDLRLHQVRVIALGGEVVQTGIKAPRADAFGVIPTAQDVRTSVAADIQIFALNGMLVREAKNATNLSNAGLAAGVYIVKATADKGSVVKKYIVK